MASTDFIIIMTSMQKPAKPSASQDGEHYLPLDHGKGERKDKPSSTQKGSGEEYSALGNSKVRKNPTNNNAIVVISSMQKSGRKPAKPSLSQAHKKEASIIYR